MFCGHERVWQPIAGTPRKMHLLLLAERLVGMYFNIKLTVPGICSETFVLAVAGFRKQVWALSVAPAASLTCLLFCVCYSYTQES